MKLLFSLSAGLVLAASTVAQAEFSLTILHTNDFHARFDPINAYESNCSPEESAEGSCFGGVARLATAIAAARDAAGASVLVDAGGQFRGTLYHTYYKGSVAAEMMNKLGYEAMAAGNHEFDEGPDALAAFATSASFPVLMANADVSGEVLLKGKILKSTVIEREGQRIGLIGLIREDTPVLSSPGPNIPFFPPVRALQAEVDRLEAEGINKIILLSHSGYHMDLDLAEAVTGVDVIVGGHSATYLSNVSDQAQGPYPTMVGDTAIVQTFGFGKYLGALDVVFDTAGKVVSAQGEPVLLDAAIAGNPEILDRMAALALPVEKIRQDVVGESAAPVIGDLAVCRAGECPMGNLVADAMLARTRDGGVQIALLNAGGLRASIDAGEITMGEVLAVLPFQNRVSSFFATGEQVLAALEHGVSAMEEGAGRFPQVAGLRFAVDPGAAPGGRVSAVEVQMEDGFVPLEPGRTYGVVTNNFLRGGGDGYAMLAEPGSTYDIGPDLADVTAAYLGKNAPYQPYTDGRIRISK